MPNAPAPHTSPPGKGFALWMWRLRPVFATGVAVALPGAGAAALAWYAGEVTGWLEAQQVPLAAACVVFAGALVCGVALVPTHAVSLLAGWTLGGVGGSAVAVAAVSLGAACAYPLGRALAGTALMRAAQASPRWRGVHHVLTSERPGRTAGLVALLRLSPLAPFAGTNVALAAVGVPFRWFLAGSVVGLAPRVCVVAFAGAGMAQLDLSHTADRGWLIAGLVATVAALLLVGRIARHALRSYTPDPGAPTG